MKRKSCKRCVTAGQKVRNTIIFIVPFTWTSAEFTTPHSAIAIAMALVRGARRGGMSAKRNSGSESGERCHEPGYGVNVLAVRKLCQTFIASSSSFPSSTSSRCVCCHIVLTSLVETPIPKYILKISRRIYLFQRLTANLLFALRSVLSISHCDHIPNFASYMSKV